MLSEGDRRGRHLLQRGKKTPPGGRGLVEAHLPPGALGEGSTYILPQLGKMSNQLSRSGLLKRQTRERIASSANIVPQKAGAFKLTSARVLVYWGYGFIRHIRRTLQGQKEFGMRLVREESLVYMIAADGP